MRYQGEGGAEFEIDDPLPGSMQAEMLANKIDKGELKPLADAEPDKRKPDKRTKSDN